MKRTAVGPDVQSPSPTKRQRLAHGPASSNTAGSPLDPDFMPEQLDQGDESDYDDHSQYADTHASTAHPTADTPLTPSSPAHRFPSDLKTIKCTFPGCDKAYNRPARLAAHLRSHTNDRPFKCSHPGCDKSYIEEKHLKQHVKGSHTAERAHTCQEPGCGKSFLTATRLRRHQAVHEGQERFRCRDFPPCNQTFRKHQTLQRHIRSDHLHVSAYPCNEKDEHGVVCGAGFDNPGSLKRHQDRQHGQLRFWCDECSRESDSDGNPKRTGFPTMTLLQAHMKHAHMNCMFCGAACQGREDLDAHIEQLHAQQSLDSRRNVTCPWDGCSKTFTLKKNLNAHIRSVHEGNRFVCGQVSVDKAPDLSAWDMGQGCGTSFSTKANLENHIRFVHLKFDRPDPPTWASAMPKSAESNILDGLTGAGSSSRHTIPCADPSCSLRFANASQLEAHAREQHGEQQASGGQLPGDFNIDIPDAAAIISTDDGLPLDQDVQDLVNWDSPGGMGQFWIGADADLYAPDDGMADEWLREEAEMRRLIGDGNFVSMIDPALGDPELRL